MVKNVLVIDDEERIRKLYTRLFHAVGQRIFQIFEASSAESATEILIRTHIDLVILDINMPKIDGRTMHEVIKEHCPQMKVLIASVYPVSIQKKYIPYAGEYYDKSEGLLQLLSLATCMMN